MQPSIIHVDSPDDPRLADYRAVRDRDLLGDGARRGLFVGESRLVVERMVALGVGLRSVLVERRHVGWMRELLAQADRPDVPLIIAPADVLRSVVGFDVHRGVLAIGIRPAPSATTLDAVLPARDRRAPRDRCAVLVLEDINNADNMGGLYRNAAAFGVDAVLLSPQCHDHLYRKAIRVSLGHALAIPTARSTDWPHDLRRLRDEWDLTLVAAATSADAVPIGDFPPPARLALAVGAEFSGLSETVLRLSDARVRIPMARGVDSLNVATAAAICLHRLTRATTE